MRNRKWPLILLLLAAATVGVCCFGPWGTTYSPLGPVTRIKVTLVPSNKEVRVIEDPAEVLRVVEFVDGHRRGWGWLSGWGGVPVPQVTASFYDGPEFKGHFGVGPGFFECQREGDFKSKTCWSWQERRFLELVGMPEHKLSR
jgi:hypothetical protein